MKLQEIKSPKGSRKKRRIVGRGAGSGRGKTAGRGENGQRSRSGRWVVGASEGGQMPLVRRLSKVGFRSHRPILNQVVTLDQLSRMDKDTIVNGEVLKEKGLINSINKPFKILANGEIKKALTIQTESISKSAQEKILKAGGKVEIIEKNAEEVKAAEKVKKEKKAKAPSKDQSDQKD